MKKKLMLDELQVESFKVDPEGLGPRGTVRAHDSFSEFDTECCGYTELEPCGPSQPNTHCDTVCESHCHTFCNSAPCGSCASVCYTKCPPCPGY